MHSTAVAHGCGLHRVAVVDHNAQRPSNKWNRTAVSKPIQVTSPSCHQLRLTQVSVRMNDQRMYGATRGVRSVRGMEVLCMAHPKRVAKVQQQLKREISSLFVYDKVLRGAIYPSERAGADFALTSLASVTEVTVTNDLQVVKVYVSILADPEKQKQTMDVLHKLEGYARKKIGQAVTLRLTPEIRFMLDDSFVRGNKVLTVLEKLEVDRASRDTSSKTISKSASKLTDAFNDEFDKYADYDDEEEDAENDADFDEDDEDDDSRDESSTGDRGIIVVT